MANTTRTRARTLACLTALSVAGAVAAQTNEQTTVQPPDPTEDAPASGVDDRSASSPIDRLVDDLDADSFERRQQAHSRLTSQEVLGSIDEPVLIKHLSREDLSAEQRMRLRRVYTTWFTRSMKHAGMGVSFRSGGPEHPGILIVQTSEGFPCHDRELLFPYDVVVAVDGVGVEEMESRSSRRWSAQEEFMRAAIVSRRAGESMRLTLQRPPESLVRQLRAADGMRQPGGNVRASAGDVIGEITEHDETEMLSIDLPLGSYTNLGANAASLSSSLVERASAMRLARRSGSIANPKIISTDTLNDQTWRTNAREPNRRAHTDLLSTDEPPQLAAALAPQEPRIRKRRPRPAQLRGVQPAAAVAIKNDAQAMLENLPEDISPKLRDAIKRLTKQSAIIKQLNERIEEQRAIATDKSRSKRERFLASGQLEQYLKQRNKAMRLQRDLARSIRIIQRREKKRGE